MGTSPIEAINIFKNKFNNIQLLISSRDCVSYLSEINFLGITLMPFSETQLYCFIQAWFKDKNPELSEVIIQNIKTKKISDIVRTPLLATLLCDLAEKGIDIPSSESEIFTKRLELLCGSYDTYKDIKRTKLSQSILIKASHKKPDEPVIFFHIIRTAELVTQPPGRHLAVFVRHREFAFCTGMWR